MTRTAQQLMRLITGSSPPPFALVHRPAVTGPGVLDILTGTVSTPGRIADLPVPGPETPGRHHVLALLPYRQITERGYPAPDDGAPLTALTITEQALAPIPAVLSFLPTVTIGLTDAGFDLDDEQYAELARRVITEEIGRGAGANFVLKRSFTATVDNWSPHVALTLFRRLVEQQRGAYWTFVVHTGERTFIGASPERHVSLDRGTAVMNPVSGTYRYPPGGPSTAGVLTFLADPKEANELYMVVDEELKMMGRLCDDGGRVTGPRLKAMSHLAHTEYLIEGHTTQDVRQILHETMFAPTVTGSPLESASEVISRYEPAGRGHYSGVIALIGRDGRGRQAMDSAVLIRTADVDDAGRLRIGVGSTLVRDSDPAAEAAETRAKAAGLLSALEPNRPAHPARTTPEPPDFASHPRVRQALAERNRPLSRFWLADPGDRVGTAPELEGRRVLILDAEDTFTAMGRHMIAALGPRVDVRRFDEPYNPEGYDLVVIGPGPGDPLNTAHPKIAHLRQATTDLLRSATPFLSICLGHQVLCTLLGLAITRRPVPNQGLQRTVDLFGRAEPVGFYNTFAARSPGNSFLCRWRPGTVHVSRDHATDEVHALRGPGFASVQFHPASVLTRNGPSILGELLTGLLPTPAERT